MNADSADGFVSQLRRAALTARTLKAEQVAQAKAQARIRAVEEQARAENQLRKDYAIYKAAQLCVQAACQGDGRIPLPVELAEWKAEIAIALDVKVRPERLLNLAEIAAITRISSNLEKLRRLLLKNFRGNNKSKPWAISEQAIFGDLGRDGYISVSVLQYLKNAFSDKSAQLDILIQKVDALSHEIRKIERGNRYLGNIELKYQKYIEIFIARKSEYLEAYEEEIERHGERSQISLIRNIEIVEKLLWSINIYVDDAHKFLKDANIYEATSDKALSVALSKRKELQTKIDVLSESLHALEHPVNALLVSIWDDAESLLENSTIYNWLISNFANLKKHKITFISWAERPLSTSIPVRRYIDWLTGKGGRIAKQKIMKYLETQSERGLYRCELKATNTKAGTILTDRTNDLKVTFPCDSEIFKVTIEQLGVNVTFGNPTSGDLRVMLSWR